MKKLVLILVLAFSFVSLGNAKQEKNLKTQTFNKLLYDPNFCWEFASAVEEADCGGPGCDIDFFEYALETCIEMTQ